MYGTRNGRRNAGRTGLLRILIVVALGALLLAGLGACGDSGGDGTATEEVSVTGAYAFDSGTEEGMEGFTLTLNDDETFMLSQTDPESGEEVSVNGTYTLDGDTIKLTNDDGSESETGTVEGAKLVFETITWAKQ